MIRIVIADDHAILRQGVRQILLAQSDMDVVGEAANYSEVMQQVRREECDVLLLDIAMPGKNGIDTLKQVKQEYPKLSVLVLSMYPEDQYAIRALKAGASGYLTKVTAADQLVHAIRQVTRGRRYITAELAESLAANISGNQDVPAHELLSDREFQTLRQIAAGRTLAQIGEELALSPKTVSVYRARLLAKLQLSTNAELTRYALEHKLVE
ncbi:MAG TPA: response regulator transcription factor [Casimicrobiaceae bacterium]|jgi:DNA-binding NarL/FixJ family response regulator